MTERKILIATPFYETKGFSPYISSLQGTTALLTQHGIPWSYIGLSGDAYVWRVRNTIANDFVQKFTDYTHLMFLDSDLAWEPEDFLRLVTRRDVDIVGSPYPIKNGKGIYTGVPFVDDEFRLTRRDDGLLRMAALATGFMMISREAFTRIDETFPEHYYLDDTATAEDGGKDRVWRDYFFHVDVHRVRLGEDYSFCMRAFKAGIPIWAQTNMTLLHFGVSHWRGNYEEYLERNVNDGCLPEELATWRLQESVVGAADQPKPKQAPVNLAVAPSVGRGRRAAP